MKGETRAKIKIIVGEANKDLIISSHNVLLKTLALFPRTIECWWKDNGRELALCYIYLPGSIRLCQLKSYRREGTARAAPLTPTLLASGSGHHRLTADGSFLFRPGCRRLPVAGGRVKTQNNKQAGLLRVEMPFYPRESLGSTEVRTCPGQLAICFPGKRHANI